MRACQGTRHPLTVERDAPLSLSFTVTDNAGISVTRSAGAVGALATPYLRGTLGDGEGWSNAFSTLRVPLVDFTAGGTGLDLGDIRFVTVEVGGDGVGRVGIDDLEVE